MNDLFVHQLRDVDYAEQQLTKGHCPGWQIRPAIRR
jgi:hypothetical protein